MKKIIYRIFGGLNITWAKLAAFAIAMGVYTALMAILVPDGYSLHDIVVTAEWWVLPAILIIVNSKKPLESALKTFVFFLISQPLVYLIQVPFSQMGWGLFGYYRYWFIITLFTFPAAFIGWFIKKDKWYSGLILSAMTILLVDTGFNYALNLPKTFPGHLLSIIYCFGMVPVFIWGIFKQKASRLVCAVLTILSLVVLIVTANINKPFEVYDNTYIDKYGISFVGEPNITYFSGEGQGSVELIRRGDSYVVKMNGLAGKNYQFDISDDENVYEFKYHFDKDQNTVILEQR